jgi:hypothetical protein
VLKGILGTKKDEGAGKWRKLHNAELNDLSSSSNIIRVIKSMRWTGYIVRMEEVTSVYKFSVGKLEGKRPLERPRCRWEDNIQMDFQKVRCGGLEWIDLAQDRDSSHLHLNFRTSCK